MAHFKPENGFTGDPIPFYWKGNFHLFYLKRKETFSWNKDVLFWAHAVTRDFFNWKELPDAILPGDEKSYDGKGCWTGCVIEKDGIFHLFYTGFNPDKKFPQTICHAKSFDLIHWEKDKENPIVIPETKIYEKNDWRDPFVFWNEKEKRWWMLITAREKGKGYMSGCIAVAKSKNLKDWKIFPPLWDPLIFRTPECCDIFKKNNIWYVFYSDHNTTNYSFSYDLKNFYFPKRISVDKNYFYAGKCFHTGDKDYLVGWIPVLKERKDDGEREWGGYLSTPREVIKKGNYLCFKLPEFMKNSFRNYPKNSLFPHITTLEATGGMKILLSEEIFSDSILNIRIKNKNCNRFGIVLRGNQELSEGYFVEFFNREVILKGSPYAISSKPFVLENLFRDYKKYDIWILMYGENLEVFVKDEIVLTAKAYNFKKGKIGIYVIDGKINEFEFLTFKT